MKIAKTLEEALNIATGWLYRIAPFMLIIAVLELIGAGTITAMTVGNGLIEEGNLPLAKAMTTYGNWVVFVFLAEILLITFLVYKTTRKFKGSYGKAFHALLMLFLLIMSTFDFLNDATLGSGNVDAWTAYFTGFQHMNPIKDFLWRRSNFDTHSSFTKALYNGTHLIEFVIECENGRQINSYPTTAMIYVGASWQEPYPERAQNMRCS